MIINHKIRDEELLWHINRKAAKISVSSEKNDKHEPLPGEQILPSDQSRILEQPKFTYSSLGKVFEKNGNNYKSRWRANYINSKAWKTTS